jgi:DNA-binding MarR family transcriptional regulator
VSYETVGWAWRQEGLPSGEKVLLVALAEFADESWSCYPGQARLSAMTGLSPRAVRDNLTRLEDRGLITRQHRHATEGYGRTSDRYRLLPADSAAYSDFQPAESGTFKRQNLTFQAAESAGEVVREPKENLKNNPPARERANGRHPAPSAQDFDLFWAAYPRRVAKQAAARVFGKQARAHGAAVIIAGARRLAADPNLPPAQYVPHPASWLNGGRWEDPPLPPRGSPDDDGDYHVLVSE